MNFLRISMTSLNKKTLEDIANIINEEIVSLPSYFKHMQWYIETIVDIRSKLH